MSWFPPLPGDQPNEDVIIPIGQTEDETPEPELICSGHTARTWCAKCRPEAWS